MKPKIYFGIVLIGLISAFLVFFQLSCKKNSDESNTFSPEEQSIIATAETFLISDFIENLKSEMISHRSDPDYPGFLDSLETTAMNLKNNIQNVTSLNDFKSKLNKFYNDITNLNIDSLKSGNANNTIDCILLKAGLGYGKGSAIEAGASGTYVDLIGFALSAQGGGSVETVYDFVTMERQVFISSVCAVGGQVGIGLEAGLSGGVGFTGYNDWILGFKNYGDMIKSMEGPGHGAQIGIFGELKIALGITAEISFGVWSDVISGCDGLVNILECPQTIFSAPFDDLHGITFAITGTPSGGPAAGLVAGVSGEFTGNCSSGINETYTNFNSNRKLASWKMAMEILNPMPFPGIITMPSGFDIIAACAALTYGNSNLTDCNSIVPQQGLMAYYPFNGNANDESGNGNNGTRYGTIWTKDRFDHDNRALYFNGSSDYISILDNNGLQFGTDDVTVGAWIKTSQVTGGRIICRGECNGSAGWQLTFDNSTNSMLVGLQHGGGATYFRGNKTINDNYWHFLCWYRKNNNIQMFIDGQANGTSGLFTTSLTNLNSNLKIGIGDSLCNYPFKGSIDDIRIFNRAISESEIQQLYHEGGWVKQHGN